MTTTVDTTKVKVGDIMAFIYYTKVVDVSRGGDRLEVENLDNNNQVIGVNGRELIERSSSADWFGEEYSSTKTDVAERLTKVGDKPFTVCFDKADGEERVLRGRLIKPEPLLGRSKVEDLDIDDGEYRLRQVDHRTIKWLIVDGSKYWVE